MKRHLVDPETITEIRKETDQGLTDRARSYDVDNGLHTQPLRQPRHCVEVFRKPPCAAPILKLEGTESAWKEGSTSRQRLA
jgi:hypothetical protein